jgi:hypothetical protein
MLVMGRFASVAVGIGALAGCASERSSHCGDWVCPGDLQCAPSGAPAEVHCVPRSDVAACAGKLDHDTCSSSVTPDGVCMTGFCNACTPDLDGCTYPGWVAMTSGTSQDLNAIWVAGRGDAYAVGKQGTFLHYDGTGWTPLASFAALSVADDLMSAWISADATNILVVTGSSTREWEFAGSSWSMISAPTSGLTAAWGAGAGPAIAVGGMGYVGQFDASWHQLDSSLTAINATPLHGIWGSDPDNVFVVGNSHTMPSASTILHGVNGTWSLMTTSSLPPAPQCCSLRAVWGAVRATCTRLRRRSDPRRT